MATFHIHQDTEKENSAHPILEKVRTQAQPKDKRPTFANLNNVTIGQGQRQQIGKAAFRDQKQLGKIQQTKDGKEENFGGYAGGNVAVVSEKASLTVPQRIVGQHNSFSVYEDDTVTVAIKYGENACANISSGAIRIPFQEVPTSDGLIQTPMSVSDASSPMSVDKSCLHLNDENKEPIILATPSRADRDRVFVVEEYQMNILEYYRELEKKYRPKPIYMQKQPDINYSMRTILVDWLVEVAEEYRLHNETLCLAVSYVDRFLSYMSVIRAKLQLVGTAAMFVAAKYEEIYPPDVGQFVYITDDTYTKKQVLRMEQVLLKTLSFNLCVPTTVAYINIYAVLLEMPEQLKHLTTYLCELSLLEGDPYLRYLPSEISSGALALARCVLDMPMWSCKLDEITSYTLGSLKEVILCLAKTHNQSLAMTQQAIQEKYKSTKYKQVSTIQSVQMNEEKFDQILQEYEARLITNESSRTNREKSKTLIPVKRRLGSNSVSISQNTKSKKSKQT